MRFAFGIFKYLIIATVFGVHYSFPGALVPAGAEGKKHLAEPMVESVSPKVREISLHINFSPRGSSNPLSTAVTPVITDEELLLEKSKKLNIVSSFELCKKLGQFETLKEIIAQEEKKKRYSDEVRGFFINGHEGWEKRIFNFLKVNPDIHIANVKVTGLIDIDEMKKLNKVSLELARLGHGLKELEVEDFSLEDIHCYDLWSMFLPRFSLKKISISGISTYDTASGLMKAFQQYGGHFYFSRIESLNLSDCSIRAVDVQELANFLSAHSEGVFPRLEELNLSKNHHIGDKGVKYLVVALMRGRPQHYPLKKLNLSNDYIGDEGVQYLAETVKEGVFSHLEELNLSNNCIGDKGVKYLVEALMQRRSQHHYPLTKLNLSNNCIGDEGVRYLAEAVKEGVFSHLEELNLSNNSIGDKGVLYLLSAHEGESSRECSMSDSDSDEPSIISPLKICRLKSLRYLNLGGNIFTGLGVCILVDLFKEHIWLKEFDISCRSTGKECLFSLLDYMLTCAPNVQLKRPLKVADLRALGINAATGSSDVHGTTPSLDFYATNLFLYRAENVARLFLQSNPSIFYEEFKNKTASAGAIESAVRSKAGAWGYDLIRAFKAYPEKMDDLNSICLDIIKNGILVKYLENIEAKTAQKT